MFTIRHFIWLALCCVMIAVSLYLFNKHHPTLQKVLSIACVICVLSEITKVFSVIRMVPSTNGTIMYPYLEMNHLPIHLCSIQILFIFYTRFTSNSKMRETLLAFMYPSCIAGAISALLMPSIFRTTVPVEKAFVHPMAYQFFIFHAMLIVVGICIARSKEIKWSMKHVYNALIIMGVLGFVSLYVNSMLASPHYVDGQLVSVDFWPNFFFTYDNPLGIKMTEMWHWYLYLGILVVVVIILVYAFYIPLLPRKKSK